MSLANIGKQIGGRDHSTVIHAHKNITEKISENIYDPINPEYVLFGLIFVNFLPLNILPNMYPPMSEQIVNIITQIKRTKDDAVSFLKCNVESNAKTKMISKSIIEVFLLNDEKTLVQPKLVLNAK